MDVFGHSTKQKEEDEAEYLQNSPMDTETGDLSLSTVSTNGVKRDVVLWLHPKRVCL